jgi:hypothetical protein
MAATDRTVVSHLHELQQVVLAEPGEAALEVALLGQIARTPGGVGRRRPDDKVVLCPTRPDLNVM